MILLTTSRRPTRRTRTFCHDFARSIPNIIRINRGKLNLTGIAEKAAELNANRIVIIDLWRSGFGKINLLRMATTNLAPVPPPMYVTGVRLQREYGAITGRVRSLVVTTKLENPPETTKIAEHLSNFFDLPRLLVGEAATKYRASMHITSDALGRIQITFMLLPQMIEIGPRITLSAWALEVAE